MSYFLILDSTWILPQLHIKHKLRALEFELLDLDYTNAPGVLAYGSNAALFLLLSLLRLSPTLEVLVFLIIISIFNYVL